MNIRVVEDGDFEAIMCLWHACGLEHPNNDSTESIRLKVEFQRDLFLVGEIEGELVGTVMAGYEGHRGWINYLGVHPEGQKKGLGRELMDAAEKKLRALGCPKVNLQVRSTNTEVVEFYKQLGYLEEPRVSMGKKL